MLSFASYAAFLSCLYRLVADVVRTTHPIPLTRCNSIISQDPIELNTNDPAMMRDSIQNDEQGNDPYGPTDFDMMESLFPFTNTDFGMRSGDEFPAIPHRYPTADPTTGVMASSQWSGFDIFGNSVTPDEFNTYNDGGDIFNFNF